MCTVEICPVLSHPSAIIEHTNRVIYLEDDDVAAVNQDGSKPVCRHICTYPFLVSVDHTSCQERHRECCHGDRTGSTHPQDEDPGNHER